MMTKLPRWLNDEADILRLLNNFIDRLDKQSAAARKQPAGVNLNEKTLPALFQLGEEADRLWDLIQSLEEDHQVIRIALKNQRDPFAPRYLQARLTLQEGGESILRNWLQRPAGLSSLQQWRKAVTDSREQFPGGTDKLSSHRIVMPGKEDASVVAAFADIGQYQHHGLSLRQLSSRCFQGNSKFLDNREALTRTLFPDLLITARPVIVSIFIPDMVEGILFIENQDSYTYAIAERKTTFNNLVLVYVAGFRGSAVRIRQADGISLHYHSESIETLRSRLESWWFEQTAGAWPVWFWGDLDFSGMAILKALKQRFTEITAWRPGYEPLLELLRQGNGHQPEMADKQAQKDPGNTGCDFSDTVLLPAIREMQTFVDQEAWGNKISQ